MTASTLTLVNFEARVSGLLDDASNQVFALTLVDESIRQVLGDLGRVIGTRPTIINLDSAAATSVDVRDEDLIVRGAFGYAARSKALDRSTEMSIGQSMPANLLELSKNALYYFEDKLKLVRVRTIQESTGNVPGQWTWDESNKNW